jgi:hypothetical protein
MTSKSTEDLIESYAEEIKKKLPLRYALCFLIGAALYWGANTGAYKSALIGTLALSPNDAISEKNSLLDISIYVYAMIFSATYVLFELIQKITEKYITYISKLPSIRDPLEKLMNNLSPEQVATDLKVDLKALEAMTNDFNLARERVEKLASNPQSAFVAGITLLYSSYYGNLLDIVVGLVIVLFSLIGLHKSCKVFIQDLLPRRAEIRRILLLLTNITREVDASK